MDPGLAYHVKNLKKELTNHGGSGYQALQRKFRIVDDDRSNTISYPEFKKAMSELGLKSLTLAETRALFNHFDKTESGQIEYEEFIQGVRDELNPRRLALVKQAFSNLDTDGSGHVDIDEMKLIYDVSKHPEFVAGRKSKNEILRLFMESFEGGGKSAGDGNITIDEFVNYYTNLGVSIDSDDYFELMIRNAWHMSGGEGQAANSANRRVLVTHANGTQEVVEIKNDLGLAQGDKEGLLKRLAAQGAKISEITVTTSAGMDYTSPASVSSSSSSTKQLMLARLAGEERAKASKNEPISPGKDKNSVVAGKKSSLVDAFSSSLGKLLHDDTVNKLPPPPPKASTQIFEGEVTNVATQAINRSVEMPTGVKSLVARMKTELKGHGAKGFHGLQRKFRIMDDDNSGLLSLGEFRKGLCELGLDLVASEIRAVFNHFDFGNTGNISYDVFIHTLRDDLTPRRRALVDLAFNVIDVNRDGVLSTAELLEKYDASKHPDVIAGKKTEEDVLREWVFVFEVGGEIDGKVTKEEFVNYYTNLGASIDSDDYFELMIRNAWHMSGGEGQAANSANARVLVTNDDGSQRVVEVQNDLGARTKEQLTDRVRKQDVHARTIDLFGSYDDGAQLPPAQAGAQRGKAGRKYIAPSTDAFKATLAQTGGVSMLAGVALPPAPPVPSPRKAGSPSKVSSVPLSILAGATARGVPEILASVRASLNSRGARGIIGLGRKFRIIDDNDSRSLSKTEFKKAMDECQVSVTPDETAALFRFFDSDNNSEIGYEEFLVGLRGPLSARRLALIDMAFAKIDRSGDRLLDPADIMQIYDASKHPDVAAGKKTSAEVLREFLETFEVGGEVDGKVTYEEFVNYYHNVSMSIDNEDYFELMMRNAWRIVGGSGAAANSANTRVLVTNADGSQEVVTLINDTAQRKSTSQTLQDVRAQATRNAQASSISFGESTEYIPRKTGVRVEGRASSISLGGDNELPAPQISPRNATQASSITFGESAEFVPRKIGVRVEGRASSISLGGAPPVVKPTGLNRKNASQQSQDSPFLQMSEEAQAGAGASAVVRRNYGHDNHKSTISFGQ